MDWLESFPEGVSLPPPLLPAPPHPPSRAQQHFVYPAYADASSSAQLWHLSQAYACAQPAWHAPWAPFDPYAPVAGPACADSTVAHHPGPSKADEQTAPPYADDEDDPFSFFDRVDAIRAEEEERGDAAAEESNAESGLAFEGAGQDAEKSIGDSMGRTAESQAGEFEKENRNSQGASRSRSSSSRSYSSAHQTCALAEHVEHVRMHGCLWESAHSDEVLMP